MTARTARNIIALFFFFFALALSLGAHYMLPTPLPSIPPTPSCFRYAEDYDNQASQRQRHANKIDDQLKGRLGDETGHDPCQEQAGTSNNYPDQPIFDFQISTHQR
jgi:hypothetical protein